jgi:hypothetical protein
VSYVHLNPPLQKQQSYPSFDLYLLEYYAAFSTGHYIPYRISDFQSVILETEITHFTFPSKPNKGVTMGIVGCILQLSKSRKKWSIENAKSWELS